MWRTVYLQCIFLLLVGLFAACEGPSPFEPPIKEPIGEPGEEPEPIDTSGVDTTGHSNPGPVIIDTLKPRNSNRFLALSKGFGTANIYSESELGTITGTYKQAPDYNGSTANLNYSFIAPQNDTLKYRPFVIFVHEGAFIYGDLGSEMGKARSMARKGYAAAAINYRLGFAGGSETNTCGGNNKEVIQAIYRGVQDTYTALHYFADKSNEFGIDPGQMMLAGSSAGSMIISALVYMDEADFEALQPGISKTLGPLDNAKGGTEFRVRSLLTYMGYSVFKTTYVNRNNAKPTVFFQGTSDSVLPYIQGNLFSCGRYFWMLGAKPASERLHSLKVPYDLNYQPGIGHVLSYSQEYIANRYAEFMKRFWSGDLRQTTVEDMKTIQDIKIP